MESYWVYSSVAWYYLLDIIFQFTHVAACSHTWFSWQHHPQEPPRITHSLYWWSRLGSFSSGGCYEYTYTRPVHARNIFSRLPELELLGSRSKTRGLRMCPSLNLLSNPKLLSKVTEPHRLTFSPGGRKSSYCTTFLIPGISRRNTANLVGMAFVVV